MEDVMSKTPPSGLALKVGNAAWRRDRGPLTLALQHWDMLELDR